MWENADHGVPTPRHSSLSLSIRDLFQQKCSASATVNDTQPPDQRAAEANNGCKCNPNASQSSTQSGSRLSRCRHPEAIVIGTRTRLPRSPTLCRAGARLVLHKGVIMRPRAKVQVPTTKGIPPFGDIMTRLLDRGHRICLRSPEDLIGAPASPS